MCVIILFIFNPFNTKGVSVTLISSINPFDIEHWAKIAEKFSILKVVMLWSG